MEASNTKIDHRLNCLGDGGRDRNRTDVRGFAVLCMTTLPLGLT